MCYFFFLVIQQPSRSTHGWSSEASDLYKSQPMHFLGLAGIARRIPDYALQFADFNKWISIGGFAFGLSQLIFLALIIKACRKIGEPVSDQVWEGAEGLEWEVPSPAPYHTFSTPPLIK